MGWLIRANGSRAHGMGAPPLGTVGMHFMGRDCIIIIAWGEARFRCTAFVMYSTPPQNVCRNVPKGKMLRKHLCCNATRGGSFPVPMPPFLGLPMCLTCLPLTLASFCTKFVHGVASAAPWNTKGMLATDRGFPFVLVCIALVKHERWGRGATW